ncbi:MAG: protein kinase [Candidatus Eisenbacteria bacterium]
MAPLTPHEPARYLPGAMIAGRWRVVALLGRGGMGEVYRADDLKLGEPVALKFLPERFERDAMLRERLLGEAKLARQVAHPNVCRVYDVGEVDGRLFLSMEYVDGEDLATLLRRIGRLPNEKALQLARQMCAGLQVAHELGIVHRDLKPSNIMIDGRGRARIADFGLAAIAESVGGAEAGAGTPAYMAPEQMEGREVTVRSDVYALGLVLYELFTGQQAFAGSTAAELLDAKRSRTPSSPSQLAPGTDPLVERVLLRCLAPDPAARPASAADVARALPGGDPLAAAIAAGETPSPEMIAEAADEDPQAARKAWTAVAVLVLCIVVTIVLAPAYSLIRRVPIEKPPAVLLDRAREVSAQLGWSTSPGDEWSVLLSDSRQAPWLAKTFGRDSVTAHLLRARGGSLRHVYRRAAVRMRPLNDLAWSPNMADPPLLQPGMLRLELDGSGRLAHLSAVPWIGDSAAPVSAAKLFELAGLDTAKFVAVTPEWQPGAASDSQAAWLGRSPGDTAVALRVEAAWKQGRPVLFQLAPPWLTPVKGLPVDPWARAQLLVWSIWSLVLSLMFASVMQARANLLAGRADARGGLRFALAAAALMFAHSMLAMHWNGDATYLANRMLAAVSRSALPFLILGSLYLTFEPVLRGTRPVVLVSWMRLLDGRLRDARVGVDVLVGLATGAAVHFGTVGAVLAWAHFTRTPVVTTLVDNSGNQTDALMGIAPALVTLLGSWIGALQAALAGAALLGFFTRVLNGRMALAIGASIAVHLFVQGNYQVGPFEWVLQAIQVTIGMMLLVRVGLVAALAASLVLLSLPSVPLSAPGSWYWSSTATMLGAIALLAAWALRSATTRRAHAALPAHTTFAPRPHAPISGSVVRATPAPPRTDTPSELPTIVSPRPAELDETRPAD